MKKIYFQPACVVVALGTCQMMAESLPIGDDVIDDPNDIGAKELNANGSAGKTIWDEEW